MLKFRLVILVAGAAIALGTASAVVSAQAKVGGAGASFSGKSVASLTQTSFKTMESLETAQQEAAENAPKVVKKTSTVDPTKLAACKAADAAEDAAEKAARAANKAADQAEDATEKTQNLSKAADQAEDQTEHAADRAEDMAEWKAFFTCLGIAPPTHPTKK